MSGLDYTKKHELGNSKHSTDGPKDKAWSKGDLALGEKAGRAGVFRIIRTAIYKLVFLSRTRLEKWLLYASLIFGLFGTGLCLYLIKVINTPAPIIINCNIEELKREPDRNSGDFGDADSNLEDLRRSDKITQ